MMKWDFLIRRGLVGRENPPDDVSPRGSAAHVRQLLEPESLDDVVELRSRRDGESPEQNGPALVQQRFEPRLLRSDGFHDVVAVEYLHVVFWRQDCREQEVLIVGLLVRDCDLAE